MVILIKKISWDISTEQKPIHLQQKFIDEFKLCLCTWLEKKAFKGYKWINYLSFSNVVIHANFKTNKPVPSSLMHCAHFFLWCVIPSYYIKFDLMLNCLRLYVNLAMRSSEMVWEMRDFECFCATLTICV